MAGRTPEEAVQNFLRPIRQVVSCVTDDQIVHREPPQGDQLLIVGAAGAVQLARSRGRPLTARIAHHYRLVNTGQAGRERWKVSTTAYYYSLDETNGTELLSYQWHPRGPGALPYPHLHLSGAARVQHADAAEAYFPTGRVALERFIWLLIEGFRVRHQRGDWRDVIWRTRRQFEQWRTWE